MSAAGRTSIPIRRVRWHPCYGVIPSRFPPIDPFRRMADPADLDAVWAVEALTNERLREEAGALTRVAPEDRAAGAGASLIMSPFTHVRPYGGRFSDATFGAYYAARSLDTAIAETTYHRERFLSFTSEPPMHIDMRVLTAHLDGELHDLRTLRRIRPELYHPGEYCESQALARSLRDGGSVGICFQSVRDGDGECVAVLRPRILSHCRQTRHLTYVWDGSRIADVYEKRKFRS